MSLLNDVLRDLAARNAPETVPAVRPVARVSAFRTHGWLIPAGMGIALVVAGTWFAQRLFLSSAPLAPRIAVASTARSEVSAAPAAAVRSRSRAPAAILAGRARTQKALPPPPAEKTRVLPPHPMNESTEAASHPPRRVVPRGAPTPPHALARTPRTESPILSVRPTYSRIERAILRRIHAGETADAWSLAQRSAPTHPARHPRYLRLYAAVAVAAGHWRSAVRLYGRLCRLEPRSTSALGGWGLSLLAVGRLRQARTVIRRALALGVRNTTLRRYLRREERRLRTRTSTP